VQFVGEVGVSGFQQARIELGARLRQLREDAGLSGKQLAERLGWQPSKVSRIENARQTAGEADVTAWGQAVGAAPEVMDELTAAMATMDEQYDSWRQRHRGGLTAIQENFRELELRTRQFRVFEPGVVIGLLQTSEYARHIFAKVRRMYGGADEVDAAIRVRMQRQEVLYDPQRTFRLLMPEAVLRYRLAPPEVMRGQLDRLLAVTTLPNVEFGILPFEAMLPSAPLNGYWIYDSRMVVAATRTKELILKNPDDIEFYAKNFEEYAQIASYGEDARAVIIRVLDDYAKQSIG
jgi:transcriptional regulator with XRE-family HTH domain